MNEKKLDKIPAILLVDDSAPIINPLYYLFVQVEKKLTPCYDSGDLVLSSIPLELLEQFSYLVHKFNVHGKFTVLPYPAGLGSILDGWNGADKKEIDKWLDIVRSKISPLFDIGPEVITHTLAFDIKNYKMLDISEWEWSQKQDEKVFTDYIIFALNILKEAGFDVTGITTPVDFAYQTEDEFVRAVLKAYAKVYNRKLTWYYHHQEHYNFDKNSYVKIKDEYDNKAVSIISKCGDYIWQTQNTQDKSDDYINAMADKYISADGKKGKIAELFMAGAPIVITSHWQSYFSNGRFTGIKIMEIVFDRITKLFGDRIEWMKCSTLSENLINRDKN